MAAAYVVGAPVGANGDFGYMSRRCAGRGFGVGHDEGVKPVGEYASDKPPKIRDQYEAYARVAMGIGVGDDGSNGAMAAALTLHGVDDGTLRRGEVAAKITTVVVTIVGFAVGITRTADIRNYATAGSHCRKDNMRRRLTEANVSHVFFKNRQNAGQTGRSASAPTPRG